MSRPASHRQNEIWMLFANGERARVQFTLHAPLAPSSKPADAYVLSEGSGLNRSAIRAAEVVYNWMRSSGRKQKPFVAGFDLFGLSKGPVSGESGGLAFALALGSALSGTEIPAVAATGEIASGHGDGPVVAVGGIEEKLKSAADTLPAGGMMFYPIANDQEISAGLREEIKIKNIGLHGVTSVTEALNLLCEPVGTGLSVTRRGYSKKTAFAVFTSALCLLAAVSWLAIQYFSGNNVMLSGPSAVETMAAVEPATSNLVVGEQNEKTSPHIAVEESIEPEKTVHETAGTQAARTTENDQPGSPPVIPASYQSNNRGFE